MYGSRRRHTRWEKDWGSDVCASILGRRIYAGGAVAKGGQGRHRVVETRMTFKVRSDAEINAYVASGEWKSKAGGYGIQGRAGAFVTRLVGSYPAVMGLPLYESVNLLQGVGWKP